MPRRRRGNPSPLAIRPTSLLIPCRPLQKNRKNDSQSDLNPEVGKLLRVLALNYSRTMLPSAPA